MILSILKMPHYCAAKNCKNKYKKGSRITFHKFPLRDKKLLKRWLVVLRRGCWKPTESSRICSCHFDEDCFSINNDRRYLRPNSVPTIFRLPGHLQKDTSKKLSEPKIQLQSVPEISMSEAAVPKVIVPEEMQKPEAVQKSEDQQTSNFNDHSYCLPTTSSAILKKLEESEQKCELLKKKLKLSRQETRRKENKVKSLQNIIRGLRERLCEHDASVIENCFVMW